jgi:hypothetical protein
MSDLAPPHPAARPAFAYSAADLAHFAGADALAAGAAVAGEEGRRLRARLLSDELAAGHRVMMRLAARADYAASNAAAFGGRDGLPFDLLAARFAGSAGRLMDQFRGGALSLPALAGPDGEGEERWVGVCFEDEALAPPEERERRLARAKAARAAAQGLDPESPQSPPPTAAEQAALADAAAAARRFVAEAQAETLAEGATPRERLVLDQVAAGHRMMMRLAGRADAQIDRLGAPDAEPETTQRAVFRLSGTAARLMERVRLGLLAVERLSAGPGGGPRKVTGYYWIGEKDLFAGQTTEDRGQNLPANDSRPAAHGPSGGTLCRPSSVVRPPNRGRLKNNNPSGDYLCAPRCGARTRAGCCCRQPAMKNGRCRFHGGKSTGPRTESGRQRARSTRLVHGFRSAEIIDLRKAAAATSRRLRTLLSGGIPAGHGVDRHVLRVVPIGAARNNAFHPRAARVAGEGREGSSCGTASGTSCRSPLDMESIAARPIRHSRTSAVPSAARAGEVR